MAFDYTQDLFGYFRPLSDGSFYVYLLLRPNGRPFYVGKGCSDRIKDHEREAKKGKCDCRKCRTIRKIWREGGEVGRQIIFTTSNEQEAYRIEAATIQRFRSRLVNVLDYDPSYLHGRPATHISRQQRREMQLDRMVQRTRKLESDRRRAILTRDYKWREEIDRELEAIDDVLWPPLQLELELEK